MVFLGSWSWIFGGTSCSFWGLTSISRFMQKREIIILTCNNAMAVAGRSISRVKREYFMTGEKWRCQEVNCGFKRWVSVTTNIWDAKSSTKIQFHKETELPIQRFPNIVCLSKSGFLKITSRLKSQIILRNPFSYYHPTSPRILCNN